MHPSSQEGLCPCSLSRRFRDSNWYLICSGEDVTEALLAVDHGNASLKTGPVVGWCDQQPSLEWSSLDSTPRHCTSHAASTHSGPCCMHHAVVSIGIALDRALHMKVTARAVIAELL